MRLTKAEKGIIKRCLEREVALLKNLKGSLIKVEGFPTLQESLEAVLAKLNEGKWDD